MIQDGENPVRGKGPVDEKQPLYFGIAERVV